MESGETPRRELVGNEAVHLLSIRNRGLYWTCAQNPKVGHFIIDEWSILRTGEIYFLVAVIWNGGTSRDASILQISSWSDGIIDIY